MSYDEIRQFSIDVTELWPTNNGSDNNFAHDNISVISCGYICYVIFLFTNEYPKDSHIMITIWLRIKDSTVSFRCNDNHIINFGNKIHALHTEIFWQNSILLLNLMARYCNYLNSPWAKDHFAYRFNEISSVAHYHNINMGKVSQNITFGIWLYWSICREK